MTSANRLRQYLTKASFASESDRYSALECLGQLEHGADASATAERERINALLAAIREHWIKANGEDSLSVCALDVIAEVIADGSYVLGPNARLSGRQRP